MIFLNSQNVFHPENDCVSFIKYISSAKWLCIIHAMHFVHEMTFFKSQNAFCPQNCFLLSTKYKVLISILCTRLNFPFDFCARKLCGQNAASHYQISSLNNVFCGSKCIFCMKMSAWHLLPHTVLADNSKQWNFTLRFSSVISMWTWLGTLSVLQPFKLGLTSSR